MYHDVVADLPPRPVPGEKRGVGTSDIQASQFRAQMGYLKAKNYQSISVEEFKAAQAKGTKIPANTVVITFDDGYEGNFKQAYPVLKEMGFKATFFLTQYVRGPDPGNRNDPAIASDYIEDPLKPGTYHLKQYHPHLSIEELKTMAAETGADGKPLFEFGAHTLTHGDLSKMSPDDARREMRGSKDLIENMLSDFGVRVKYLAYPEGRYSPETVGIAKETDEEGEPLFETAFAVGLKDQVDPNYAIPRLPITRSAEGELRDRRGRALNTTTLGGFKAALDFWKTYRPSWERAAPPTSVTEGAPDLAAEATVGLSSLTDDCLPTDPTRSLLPSGFEQEVQEVLSHASASGH